MKDFQDKNAYVSGRPKKGTDSGLFFALNGFLEKNGKYVLESP